MYIHLFVSYIHITMTWYIISVYGIFYASFWPCLHTYMCVGMSYVSCMKGA